MAKNLEFKICNFGINKSIFYRYLAFLFLFFFVGIFSPIYAADFKSSYSIEYFIQDDNTLNLTKTAYTIRLTNLQPDLVIKRFTLSFPRSFGVGNIIAKDDNGSIIPQIVDKDRSIEVSFELNSPKAGLNEINTLYLDFQQKNIFHSKGTIWEVFIPTLESKSDDTFSISVYLPPGKHKKLSLAKPMPDLVTFDRVVWNSNIGKSIYAVFGEKQQYNLDLTYHLSNPNIYRVYTDVAFPPDTLYQQVLVTNIIPKPDLVFSDTDGNYMGRYNLNGKEEKYITFKGTAIVSTLPREDYKEFVRKQFEEQRKTLFNPQPFWKLDNETPVQSSSVHDYYQYTVNTLTYNFNRIIKGNSRMGAAQALKFPDQAVCTEYSDLFIASARQRGIFVREIQGFAFANEQELRPVQQDESDILHSWVEYFDTDKKIWIPIDPTWEDTSGIDYFNSFDFNHVVFAIHGKKADYPYPAGSYKSVAGGKDVRIEPSSSTVLVEKKVAGTISTFPIPQSDDQFGVNLKIVNTGNVSLLDVPISVAIKNGQLKQTAFTIPHLLPGEEKIETIVFTPKYSLFSQDVTISIFHEKDELSTVTIQVPTVVTTIKNNLYPLLFIVMGISILIVILRKKNDRS